MSHYATIVVVIKDEKSLVKALKEIYGQDSVEIHNNPKHLFDYQGHERPETANIIVRRKHIHTCSNDLGFVRNASGHYTMIVSDYDKDENGPIGTKGIQRIMSYYAEHYIKARYPGKFTVNRKDKNHITLLVRT